MNMISKVMLGSAAALALAGGSVAQDKPAESARPAVLVIQREYLKPGKAGAAHQKAESSFVQAMSRAQWPTHYLAMQSLSGKPRVLFLTRYASYDAWERDAKAMEASPELSAAMDKATEADGALLESYDQGVFRYNEDLSFRPLANLAGTHMLEIWVVHVKPGHDKEFEDAVKMAKAGNEKNANVHWGAYQAAYGSPDGTYLFLTARRSASELDKGKEEGKTFSDTLGGEGMKNLSELFAASADSSEAQLFAYSPEMSYPDEEMVKADPDFWQPKAEPVPTKAAAKKKEAAKPQAGKTSQ